MRLFLPLMAAVGCLVLVVGSCQRRPLEDEFYETALIPINIDWSESGIPEGGIYRATVWFFPHDGGKPIELVMQKSLTYAEVELPMGTYSVVVHNETTDPDDWTGISFVDANRYEDFSAVAKPVSRRGFYTRSDEHPLIENPDYLAAWSLDTLHVTRDMVLYTRSKSKSKVSTAEEDALFASTKALSAIKPKPRMLQLTVSAYVENLSSAMQGTGIVNGMSTGVYMASGQRMATAGSHPFIFDNRQYDDNGKDGTVWTTMTVFGKAPNAPMGYDLPVDFVLYGGQEYPTQVFDVADKLETEHYAQIKVEIGIPLPDMGKLDSGITVDDWEKVVVPIK